MWQKKNKIKTKKKTVYLVFDSIFRGSYCCCWLIFFCCIFIHLYCKSYYSSSHGSFFFFFVVVLSNIFCISFSLWYIHLYWTQHTIGVDARSRTLIQKHSSYTHIFGCCCFVTWIDMNVKCRNLLIYLLTRFSFARSISLSAQLFSHCTLTHTHTHTHTTTFTLSISFTMLWLLLVSLRTVCFDQSQWCV